MEMKKWKLDPRLRRLLSSKLHDDCIAADVGAGYLQCVDPVEERRGRNKDNTYARVLLKLSKRPDWEDLEKEGHVWRRPVHIAGGYYTAEIRLSHLAAVAARPAVQYMEAGRLVLPTLDTSVLAIRARGDGPGFQTHLDGTGVVTGIVDYGINYLLDDFRDKNGKTRIAYLWDQELQPKGELGEHSPEKYGYGVEYDAAAIDMAIDAATDSHDVDAAFLKVRHKPKGALKQHGTLVAGIVAGNGRTHDNGFAAGKYVGVAPGATIVFVHLSRKQILAEVQARETTLADSVRLADAIAYCFEQAGDRPCVVNLSMGFNGGGHDGHSPVEEIIDSLLENKQGRAVVIAAGNEHGKGIHYSGTLEQGHTDTLQWTIGILEQDHGLTVESRDPTLNEMEIWYSSKDRCQVRLVDPDNDSTPAVDVGKEWPTDFGGEASPFPEEAFIQSEGSTVLNPDAARIYVRLVPPTAGTIRAGRWQVKLKAQEVNSGDGRFDAWIEREANLPRDDPRQSKFANAIETATLTTPGTAHRAITVANYRHHETEHVADDSGRGPTRDRQRAEPKPEVAAPGTRISSSNALFGLVAGAEARQEASGTSMAAPHVAGVIALLLQRARQEGVGLTSEDIRKILIVSAGKPPGVSEGKHDPAWGYGTVDAQAAIEELERNFL